MQLDFTSLQQLARKPVKEEPVEKRPTQSAQAAFYRQGEYKNTSAEESATEGQETQNSAIPALQREADNTRQALQAAAEVYRQYQENIRATEQLQAQILKGIRNHESIHTLFLTAAKALALTVNNREFYQQIQRELPQRYPEAAGKI